MKPNGTMATVEAVKTGWRPGAGALASKVAVGPHWQLPGPTVGAAGMSPCSGSLRFLNKD